MELKYIPLPGISCLTQSSVECARDGGDYSTSRGTQGGGELREGA